MIKVHEGLYINEEIIALAAMDPDSGGVRVLFRQPIEFPKVDEETGEETLEVMLSISIDEEYADGFFRSLELIAFSGFDEELEDVGKMFQLPNLKGH